MGTVIVTILVLSLILSILWTNSIDKMLNEHPDYKGEDFLNWDGNNQWPDSRKKEGKEDGWDDNKVHGEGNFG